MYHNHTKIKHSPIAILRPFLILSDLIINNKNARTHMIGNAYAAKSNSNPRLHNITHIAELHILHHMITLAACANSIIPADTKDSKINNTAELHCKIMVARKPIHNVLKILFVAFFIICLIHHETIFFVASSKKIIQSMNNHKPHINNAILSNVILKCK